MDWVAIELTAILAAATTGILFVAGVPLAYWLASTKARWRFLVDGLVALPLVLPPTVLGYYLLVGMGVRSPVGKAYAFLFDSHLPFTFPGLLIGSVLYSLPFAVRPFSAAMEGVDPRLLKVARSLGCSPLSAFLRVTVPLAWPGILGGLVLTFVHTVGEFGVVLMIGGNIPGVTRTLSISIYDDVAAMDFEKADTTALALLVFSFTALCITFALQRRGFRM